MSAPTLYARWLAELLPGPLPSEPGSTCESCAMCSPSGAPSDSCFSALTKCCTFFPDLPNFVVGRILDDASAQGAEGRARLSARIEAGAEVTPLGVFAPPQYSVQYKLAEPAFGRSTALRCPYFVEEHGACSIWPHRISTCYTWYCKHTRGAVGLRFWTTLRRLLKAAERAVAQWCLLELNLEPTALTELVSWRENRALDASALDGYGEHGQQGRLWRSWKGREQALYARCGELVSDLGWSDIRRAGGAALQLLERVCVDTYNVHARGQVPERLKVGRFSLLGIEEQVVRVASYNAYDPIELPRAVLALLHRFDGRETATVLGEILSADAIELEPELVQLLVDFEILERCD